MEIIKTIIEYLFNTTHRLLLKITLIITVIGGLILIDNLWGLTYYNNLSNKLEQIQTINNIIRDTVTPSELRNELVIVRSQVIKRRNAADNVGDFFQHLSWTSVKQKVIFNSVDHMRGNRNLLWQILSCVWPELFFLAIGSIVLTPSYKRTEEEQNKVNNRFLLFTLLATAIGYLHVYLFSFIPVPFGFPLLSYLTNILLNLGLIYLIIKVSSKFIDSDDKEKEVTKGNLLK